MPLVAVIVHVVLGLLLGHWHVYQYQRIKLIYYCTIIHFITDNYI
jgi:hypothetical protein